MRTAAAAALALCLALTHGAWVGGHQGTDTSVVCSAGGADR